MQKHITIEQDLNEEQLRAITGGCNGCIVMLRQAAAHQQAGDTFHAMAQLAQQRVQQAGTVETRNFYQGQADHYGQLATAHYDGYTAKVAHVLNSGHIR